MHHFILLLIKPAATSPHGCSPEHGTVMLACLYVRFPNVRSRNVPSVFYCDSLEVRAVALGVAYQKPIQRVPRYFPAAPSLLFILL